MMPCAVVGNVPTCLVVGHYHHTIARALDGLSADGTSSFLSYGHLVPRMWDRLARMHDSADAIQFRASIVAQMHQRFHHLLIMPGAAPPARLPDRTAVRVRGAKGWDDIPPYQRLRNSEGSFEQFGGGISPALLRFAPANGRGTKRTAVGQ